jgi:hypothetical protein
MKPYLRRKPPRKTARDNFLIQIIRNVCYCGKILEFKNVVNDLFFKYFDVNN